MRPHHQQNMACVLVRQDSISGNRESVQLHWRQVMSHESAILTHLKSGRPITALDALRMYGCMRLAARVYDLRDSGHDVIARTRHLKNGKKVAEYVLINQRKK